MSIGVVVPAAGIGRRMNQTVSKQFLTLQGVPVLVRTLCVFQTHPQIDEIVVVTRQEEISRVRDWVDQYHLTKVKQVVPGGNERQDSVYLGLKQIQTEWVLVHDAVRPLVTHHEISRLIENMYTYQSATLAVPVKDTIKKVDSDGFVIETPKRSQLWLVQTPQAFQREKLLLAHEEARRKGHAVTDDAMLLELLGEKVKIVQGEYTNIKLTTPEDFDWAETILKVRGEQHDTCGSRI